MLGYTHHKEDTVQHIVDIMRNQSIKFIVLHLYHPHRMCAQIDMALEHLAIKYSATLFKRISLQDFYNTDVFDPKDSTFNKQPLAINEIFRTPIAPKLDSSTAVFTSTTLSIALAMIGISLSILPIDQEGLVKS